MYTSETMREMTIGRVKTFRKENGWIVTTIMVDHILLQLVLNEKGGPISEKQYESLKSRLDYFYQNTRQVINDDPNI